MLRHSQEISRAWLSAALAALVMRAPLKVAKQSLLPACIVSREAAAGSMGYTAR
jgi:hypothetical protein